MPYVNGKYYTQQEIDDIRSKTSDAEFEKFLISGVIGAVTGSTILGGLLGGSFLGGLAGDILEGNDDSLL